MQHMNIAVQHMLDVTRPRSLYPTPCTASQQVQKQLPALLIIAYHDNLPQLQLLLLQWLWFIGPVQSQSSSWHQSCPSLMGLCAVSSFCVFCCLCCCWFLAGAWWRPHRALAQWARVVSHKPLVNTFCRQHNAVNGVSTTAG